MALDERTVVRVHSAAQYDGTNGTEIAAVFGTTPDSDDGQTLMWTFATDTHTVQAGEWVLWRGSPPSPAGRVDDVAFQVDYAALPEAPEPPAPPVITEGTAALPGSVLGATQVITVTLAQELISPVVVAVEVRGENAGLLGSHVVTGHAVVDGQTVQVTVQSGAAAPAGQIRVAAFGLPAEGTS